MNTITFEEWQDELRVLVWEVSGNSFDDDEDMKEYLEAFRPYYDDGYTPTDALKEDMSYGI